MLSKMPIRKKILCGTVLLTCTLLLLMYSSLRGVYAYRQVAHLISHRAAELPIVSQLQVEIDELRFNFRVSEQPQQRSLFFDLPTKQSERFSENLDAVIKQLSLYEKQLQSNIEDGPVLADRSDESNLVKRIKAKVEQMQRDRASWELGVRPPFLIERDLEELGVMVHQLPTFLHARMARFSGEVRARYRTWIFFISISAAASFLILGIAFLFFRRSIVQPFKVLLAGSRSIASGKFEHRIALQSHDELAELGNALNDMTTRFIEIRDTLNEKVKQRTSEVVRSEQLASVGFLAAGVAHEINNPLASIAWSAEALESRLHEILHVQCPEESEATESVQPGMYDQEQLDVLRKYLRRIQDEAFRCKGITERLLDFSRLSESQRKQETDINESISDVIALVQHLGQYRNKRLEYSGQSGLSAWVSPPEFKQVVLNLLTNALDSLDDGGLVTVKLEHKQQTFALTIADNGCGMTPEVKNHLFEPFFTRRRDGRGTGLGLSITYRIVQDHAGELVALSDGPGQGSTFILTMPLENINTQSHETIKAAA